MEFEYEEKEQYTQEEVQAIVESFKNKAIETISAKDAELTGLTTEYDELKSKHHKLNISTLMKEKNIDEDLFDLVVDEDIKVVKKKIEKLATATAKKDYKPSTKREDTKEEKAYNQNDVKSSIKYKVNKLFTE